MARHKPIAEGGYQRGEQTRMRIVGSALRLFGERGFAGASTRDIASDAGVNPPALQYYFDNKEGVYLACLEHLIDRIWGQLQAPAEQIEKQLANPLSTDEQLIDVYLNLIGAIIVFIHDSPSGRDWSLFMAREQVGLSPPGALDLMEKRLYRRISSVTAAVVGRLTMRPADDERTLIRTFAINNQGMVFRVLPRQALSMLGWDNIDSQRMKEVIEVLLGQTRLTLQALVLERDAGRL